MGLKLIEKFLIISMEVIVMFVLFACTLVSEIDSHPFEPYHCSVDSDDWVIE